MRRLMWFSAGFAAACAAGVYLLWGRWMLLLILAFGAFLGALVKLKSKKGRVAAVVFLGMIAGAVWLWGFDCLYLSPVRALDGTHIRGTAELTDYSYPSVDRSAAEGKLELDGKTYRVKVYFPEQEPLPPGSRISADFWLRYTAAGGERDATFHQGQGIFLLVYAKEDVQVQKPEQIPAKYFPQMLREGLRSRLDALYPEDTAGFARALLLGDDWKISRQDDKAMQLTGIRHVIAVSGLHVSILFGMIYFTCGKRKGLTAAVGIPLLVLFAAVAGFTPSVVRACLMQLLMILAILVNREYDPPTALGFAVLVILAVNPMAITSVAFQLSAGSMLGIMVASKPIQAHLLSKSRLAKRKKAGFLRRIGYWFSGSVGVTLGAMVVTTPLCAYYFGSISLVSVLACLLTLWVVTYIFCGIVLSCVASLVWMSLAAGIAWLISWPMRYVLWVSRLLSGFPLAAVYTASVYIVVWLVFCYVLLLVFLRTKKRRPALMAGCMALGLAAAILCSCLEPRLDTCRVTVMDVGQGQSVLLQSRGDTYLVDCGSERGVNGAEIAVETMLSQGITHLDGIILTHFDSDHVNGVPEVLDRVAVDRLYLPDIYDDSGIRERIVAGNESMIEFVRETKEIPLETGTLTVFPSKEGTSDNESGLCILFQPADYDILITGDRGFSGEQELMEQTDLPQLELLVVGHHGSRYSTGLEFLRETFPAAAVISAGENNSYGHPAQETLDRLELFGCKVLRTDLSGTITFRG